ncbi:hypothetical protein [Paenibacillus sp. J14]|uniref:hypothetical protein n=2 Tax=Paenibacillus TaxID=44249 RepID=UPI00048DE786|nr:hypothetical protein [Paenibacillus sp. J14]
MNKLPPNQSTNSSLQEVEKFVIQTYSAKKIPVSNLEELRCDPQVKFDRIAVCFEMDHPEVLKGLFNEDEKKMHEDYRNHHRNATFTTPWQKINAGQLLRVVLESEDGVSLSNFTVQGLCMRLVHDLSALKGQ